MPKIDEKKEQLNEFRRWQGYCVTVLIALIAFIATQYDKVADFFDICKRSVNSYARRCRSHICEKDT